MQNLLMNINLLLAQSAAEKKMTWLYLALFAFLIVFLLLDSTAGKKWLSNKVMVRVTWVFLFIVLIVMAILYFVL